MCQIFRVHIFFCRKLFFAFCFSSFIQSNKKKLRQDASNRNPKAMDQPLGRGGGFWIHWFWVRGKPAAPTCSLSQASYTGGRGRGRSGGGGWGGGCQRFPLPLHLPSAPPPWVCPNTRLWHLSWQTQLLSFQYWKKDKMALCLTQTWSQIDIQVGFGGFTFSPERLS